MSSIAADMHNAHKHASIYNELPQDITSSFMKWVEKTNIFEMILRRLRTKAKSYHAIKSLNIWLNHLSESTEVWRK